MKEKVLIYEKNRNIKFVNLSNINLKFQSFFTIPLLFLTAFMFWYLLYWNSNSTSLENWDLLLGIMVISFSFSIIMMLAFLAINIRELFKAKDKFGLAMFFVFDFLAIGAMLYFGITGTKDLTAGSKTFTGKYELERHIGLKSPYKLKLENGDEVLLTGSEYYDLQRNHPDKIQIEYLLNFKFRTSITYIEY